MTRPARHRFGPRLAVGFNAVAALGCVALIVMSPTRAGTLLAGAGLVFFALATVGFALLLRIAAR